MTGFYDEDLAYIHHAGFGDMVLGATPGLLALLRRAGVTSGLVVDLGCGPGLWLRELLSQGYGALGVDVSPAFVALSRETAPGAELRLASAHDLELPPCAAVTAISEVLCYAPADDPPPLAETAHRIHRALQPGGLLIFDVIVQEPGPPMAYRTWREGEDWAILIEVEEDRDGGWLTRDMTLFRDAGGGYRRSRETHRQRLFRAEEIETWLRDIGFEVETARAYGYFELAPRRMAFVCRKPATG